MSTENDVEEKLEEAFDKIQRMFSLQFTGNPDAKLDFSNIISGENKELKEGILEEKKYTILKVIITFAVASFSLICYQILSFFQKLGIEISYLFFAIPWMILLVVYVIIVMKINKKQEKVSNKNNENYNSKIVIKAIREVLPNASVNAESFIPASMLFATGAVPRFDIQEGEYFVSYNKNNKAYGFSNIRLEYVSSDGEDSRYRSETIFRGQIFQILQSFNIDGMVCIRTKTKKRYFHYRKKDRREKRLKYIILSSTNILKFLRQVKVRP